MSTRPGRVIPRYRALLTSLNTRNGAPGCPGPNLVLRHLGMAQRWSGDLPASLETLTQAVAAPGAPQETLLARLERGKTLDALNRRQDALREYQTVAASPLIPAAASEASDLLTKPYRPEPR